MQIEYLRLENFRCFERALARRRRTNTSELREQIIEAALCDGYRPVWYAAFAGDPDLRLRLIRAARGTCQTCWDEWGAPIERAEAADSKTGAT